MDGCNHSDCIQNGMTCHVTLDETGGRLRVGNGVDGWTDLGYVTAAAGWCAPSETVYSLMEHVDSIDWNEVAHPTVPRGGLRFPAITQEVADILTGRLAASLDLPAEMLQSDTGYYGPDRE